MHKYSLLAACLSLACLAIPAQADFRTPSMHSPARPATTSAALSSLESASHDLPRFAEVNPGLLRGGQPTDQGFEMLRRAGVKTIINLRTGHNAVKEGDRVRALGMNYLSIPMKGLDKPSPEQITTFLNTVTSPASQPVFMHCQFGEDRTGTMVAIYRISQDGWTARRAYNEMCDHGFHQLFVWLADAVFEYARSRGIASEPS